MEGPLRVGVISDTHGLLRPEALAALAGADRIVHAGDVGRPDILDALAALAPVTAVRGNADRGAWAEALPEAATLRLAGVLVHVVHDLAHLDPAALLAGAGVVVSGHSHRPRVETREGVLFLNPGAAGPRRFHLPVAVATLTLAGGRAEAAIHMLG